jgi:hypothetical protein
LSGADSTILDGDNMAIPLPYDAGFDPRRYALPEAIILSREILRPVIEMKLTVAASRRTPAHSAGFVENMDTKAALGQ